MASGMARGAAARGKRIAFGDGTRILWDHHSEAIFQGNPNVAKPGAERDDNLEWIPFYRGHRIYNRQVEDRWVWNLDFRPTPGEVFFSEQEITFAKMIGRGFVAIEPNVPDFKTCAPNKQWSVKRYDKVARYLSKAGLDVIQFVHAAGHRVPTARQIKTPTFRHALAILERASLYIGPEGGLHHGAATVGVPAVVLFGGFVPPQVTGYPTHTNLTGGAVACGSLKPCAHCAAAMEAITVDEVHGAALGYLKGAA